MASPARRCARSAEIPQYDFAFHKFGLITAEAPELKGYNFLSPMPGGRTGFWMKTKNSKIFFELTKTEMQDDRVYCWVFSSVGWTPHRRQAHVSIFNSGVCRLMGAVSNDR
jgi:hypothetical protein